MRLLEQEMEDLKTTYDDIMSLFFFYYFMYLLISSILNSLCCHDNKINREFLAGAIVNFELFKCSVKFLFHFRNNGTFERANAERTRENHR